MSEEKAGRRYQKPQGGDGLKAICTLACAEGGCWRSPECSWLLHLRKVRAPGALLGLLLSRWIRTTGALSLSIALGLLSLAPALHHLVVFVLRHAWKV